MVALHPGFVVELAGAPSTQYVVIRQWLFSSDCARWNSSVGSSMNGKKTSTSHLARIVIVESWARLYLRFPSVYHTYLSPRPPSLHLTLPTHLLPLPELALDLVLSLLACLPTHDHYGCTSSAA